MQTALKDSGFSAAEINEVVFVGGMTRMPKIIETVKNFLEKNQIKALILMKLLQWSCYSRGVLQGDVKDVFFRCNSSLGIETLEEFQQN